MEKSIRHGTQGGYTHGKCRCDKCSAAMLAYQAAYRERNRERIKARDRAYDLANREARRAYDANRDKAARAAAKRERYMREKDLLLSRVKAWQLANPASRTATRAKRRALKLAADTRTITAHDWRRLMQRYDGRCAYCRTLAPLTQDHVIPLVRGGRHALGNLLPACGPCNSSKGPLLLIEWSGRPTR